MKNYEAPICDLHIFGGSDLLMDSNGLVEDNLSDLIKKALSLEE